MDEKVLAGTRRRALVRAATWAWRDPLATSGRKIFYIMPNLDQALKILEHLSAQPQGSSVTEIAKRLGLRKNSVFRIARTLAANGFLLEHESTHRFSPKILQDHGRLAELKPEEPVARRRDGPVQGIAVGRAAVATYLAGVDIGTSGAKAMVFDLAGNPLASAYQEYPCTYPRPGWVEQDADHLDAMARAVVQSGVKRILSTQNCEQHFTPTAKGMIRMKIKISRIHLTNSPKYEILRHIVCYLEQDQYLLHGPEERGMKAFDFSVPTRVFFGNGELRRLQEVAPLTGKRAMLLAAKQTMKQTGILERAVELFKKASVEVVVSNNVNPNPKNVGIDRQPRVFLTSKCDFAFGLDGGKLHGLRQGRGVPGCPGKRNHPGLPHRKDPTPRWRERSRCFPSSASLRPREPARRRPLEGDHEHEMARETWNGQRQHRGALFHRGN